jgi:tetratricopeptide (TPR) repeat protein
LIYAEMGEPDYAIAAYEEALVTYRRLGNREAIASVQLNVGAAHRLSGRLSKAVDHYAASLTIFEEIEMPRGQAQTHYNLAEAFASLGQTERAQHHWRAGYALSRRAGLDDQLHWFDELRDQSPTFQELAPAQPADLETGRRLSRSDPVLLPEEQVALALARQTGWVTTKTLMAQIGVSKATATRRLTGLVEQGFLVKAGQGRATRYTLP